MPRSARWSHPGGGVLAVDASDPLPAARPGPARRAGRPGGPRSSSPARPPSSARTRPPPPLRVAHSGWVQSSTRATAYISSMSVSRIWRMWGAAPCRDGLAVDRTARCTWPIEAAANGCAANERKTPRGAATPADDLLELGVGKGATSLSSLNSSFAVGGGEEIEAQRQHLAQLDPGAPSCSSAERIRTGPLRPGAERQGRQDEGPGQDDQHPPDPRQVPQPGAHTASGERAVSLDERRRAPPAQGPRHPAGPRRRPGWAASSSHSRPRTRTPGPVANQERAGSRRPPRPAAPRACSAA